MFPVTFHEIGNLSEEDRQKACEQILQNLGKNTEDGSSCPKRRRLMSPPDSGIGCSNSLDHPLETTGIPSGIILEVRMENFLSHQSMVVYLNKDINFIIGDNGSGKSAILTAIIVALGGNATSTGRGIALKDFIRRGSSVAKVICIISNSHERWSFKREIYGRKILIERTLLMEGASRIKIKSESGKLVSTKMEELRAMTLRLGIQVTNPISVLDQNSARHFVNESKPEVKFELFMKATSLQSLSDVMTEIDSDLKKISQELNAKERQLRENNKELNEAQEKLEKLNRLEEDRKTSLILKMELLWAQVRDCKNLLESAENNLKITLKKKEEVSNFISGREITADPFLDKIESSKKVVASLDNQKKDIENERRSLLVCCKALKKREKEIVEDEYQSKVQLEKCEKFISEYKSEIKSQEERMLPEHAKRRREQEEEVSEMQRNAKQLLKNYESKKRELQDLQAKANDLRTNLIKVDRIQISNEVELDRLTRLHVGYMSAKSSLSLFGPCMTELVRAINNTNGFKEKPLGPLGSFIELNDPKWALAIENAIGSIGYAFAVTSKEDEKLLMSLIKKICLYGPKIPIRRLHIARNPIDTSKTCARTPQYGNILDMITFRNARAGNVLIELCNLDTTLLIPSGDECFTLLSKRGSVPRNCRRAYTLEGDYYNPSPTYGTYYGHQSTAKYLNSCEDVIRQTQFEISETEKTLKATEKQCSALRAEQNVLDSQIKLYNADTKKMLIAYDQIQAKILNLREETIPDVQTVALLRDEISEKEKYMTDLKVKMDKLQTELQVQLPEKLGKLKSEDDELQLKLTEINCQLENLLHEQNAWIDARKELESSLQDKKNNLEKIAKEEGQLRLKVQELEIKHTKMETESKKYESHVVDQFVEQLDRFTSKFNTNRAVKTIDNELCSINKRIRHFEKAFGQSSEEFEQDYHEKVLSFNVLKEQLEHLRINAKTLQKVLNLRKKICHTVKNITSVIVSHQFGRVLLSRNCSGKIVVNFQTKTLEIIVHPMDEGERAGKGTSSLSGGERSFATVAFIIALWNVTDLPFYFLDEFDVFLDPPSRVLALQLLLKFAKLKPGHQFGFITPHTLPGVCDSPEVTIFRLADPVRQ
ncbi:hypothetical protein FOCC_FOCC000538 [Frankliniella occidentalis]|uniref:Structural maintenance of chromosomes protein 6 n=1 Tax=Frankliniella occidentalis TaxID=133901 RepID=A0A6J1RYJ8_FRAOC|nr:structural maintenance of chromosomes protein 6 [Frankliniella occidentalis]KAE8752800.1 hypothetical protein FOCC_FOCC000538 [Frankliniella occidentalis]